MIIAAFRRAVARGWAYAPLKNLVVMMETGQPQAGHGGCVCGPNFGIEMPVSDQSRTPKQCRRIRSKYFSL